MATPWWLVALNETLMQHRATVGPRHVLTATRGQACRSACVGSRAPFVNVDHDNRRAVLDNGQSQRQPSLVRWPLSRRLVRAHGVALNEGAEMPLKPLTGAYASVRNGKPQLVGASGEGRNHAQGQDDDELHAIAHNSQHRPASQYGVPCTSVHVLVTDDSQRPLTC